MNSKSCDYLYKFKLVSVLLTLIASAIDVALASLMPLSDQSKLVSVLFTLMASVIEVIEVNLIEVIEYNF